ncbi:MAG TPA: amino acid adenylation domain-containing protein [Burkholderiaceae bacterium]|nr:amino acid adenylation domain-containing protein [Burkholderiaceae bacterium]
MTSQDSQLSRRPALTQAQARLLARRLRQSREDALSNQAPQPCPGNGPQPLSYAQEALWFVERLTGPGGTYNIVRAWRIDGALDVPALTAALQGLVKRQPALRSFIVDRDGRPEQQTQDDVRITVPVIEVPAGPQQAGSLERLLNESAAQPFDLDTAPLVRARLYRLGPQAHVLLLVVHHIVGDGWSMGVLARELDELYRAAREGRPARLPELPFSFADWANWQRRQIDGPLAEQLVYWREQLAGLQPLQMPMDRPRATRLDGVGDVFRFTVPQPLARRVRELARSEGVTSFMLLLAAFNVLLARYSGQDDVVVGSPVAGRAGSHSENLIGYFVNSIVLRTRLVDGQSVRDLLRQVRQVCVDAYAHAEVPFDRLVAELSPERELGRNPLYQVSFALNPAEAGLDRQRLGDLALDPLRLHTRTAKFDLSLALSEGPADELTGALEYNSQLYDSATIERFGRHFLNLLEQIAAGPQTPVSRLSLMDEAERRQVVEGWNETRRRYREGVTLADLVEEQVLRTPGAVAVQDEHEAISYGALNERANRLAHWLQAKGVGPDARVGVAVERSVALVVALLGIAKAGGAYVPLDPEYPAERLTLMLEDAEAKVVLTQTGLLPKLPLRAMEQVLCLDEASAQAELSRMSVVNPRRTTGERDLAYVIFTSGSTGRPKGVMIEHRGICNHVQWISEKLKLSAADRLLQRTSISFDASVWEFFAPLQVGARLVLAKAGGQRDPGYLAKLACEAGITVMQSVPSELRALLEEPQFGRCETLRYMISGGEALERELAQGFLERFERATLGNFYGPSEASNDSACLELTRETGAGAGAIVAIGRPIANARCHILDGNGEPVPVGAIGELHIGGVGLARGYLKRADLTQQKFVADPFRAGERLYRTGDLARYRADGVIEYAGRIDHQVKLRGLRIELGEIEAALAEQAGVGQSVVMVREDRPGQKMLVAYVVAAQRIAGQTASQAEPVAQRVAERSSPQSELADQGVHDQSGHSDTAHGGAPMTDPSPLCQQALRAALAQRLPEYMVPTAIVVLQRMPLSPNGKIDRAALPAPSIERDASTHVPPSTASELLIAQAWSEVLGEHEPGIHDSFFALGGHSLLAARTFSRIRALSGIELPLRALFETPTIAGLARVLDAARAAQGDGPVLADVIPRLAPGEALAATPAQQSLWFIDRLFGASGVYNIPHALRLRGALDRGALLQALRALVDRHDALRTCFDERDGEVVPRVLPQVHLELPVVELADDELEESALLAQLTAAAAEPFELSRAPLLRARLYRLGSREHVLLLCIHHIVSDGWSIEVLACELDAFYRAAREGRAAHLAPLAIGFADFAVWQKRQLDEPAVEEHLAFWRRRLADSAVLQLPTDRPRSTRPDYQGRTLRFAIDADVMAPIRTIARQHDATLFQVLLAAFDVLLARYGGQTDVIVGSPVAGRARAETEGLIGYFVNSIVLRTDLSGEPTFAELLARVRATCIDAQAHQDLPFDRLVAELSPEREIGRNPLYQVSFSFANQSDIRPPVLGDLGVEPIALHTGTAKFDLSLGLTEHADGTVAASLEYATQLYDHVTIERIARHLVNLLRQIGSGEALPVARLRLMDEAERRQVVEGWNETRRRYREGVTLADLVEEQVLRTPGAVAVQDEHEAISYGALNERANRLAHWLQAKGVGPDARVGVAVERSVALVVALLGIAKAGGAYVPLDPEYPAERLTLMLEDAEAKVVLTQTGLLPKLPLRAMEQVLCLDEASAQAELSRMSVVNPRRTTGERDLAYVIFTSGSTGRPKGVMIEHRGICNHVQWISEKLKLSAADRLLQRTSISFDASVWEFFAPLQVGARLVLAKAGGQRDPGYLAKLACEAGITVMQSVPSELRALLEEPQFGRCETLRYMISGGEALERELAQGFLERFERATLGNFYGPSEASNDSACLELTRETGAGAGAIVAIGRPIANARCHILDGNGEPVPVGAIGELHIGGVGLARGYLKRADLTQQKFVADPFRAGERLYRTGDLARYRADGVIEYAGRIDHQVKLRGLRIELGEIEAALAEQAGVGQSVVMVREDRPGQKMLVAYVVAAQRIAGQTASQAEPVAQRVAERSSPQSELADQGVHDQSGHSDTAHGGAPMTDPSPLCQQALRAALAQRLPEYMVPTAIVVLQRMPLSPNGKIDRAALPAPSIERDPSTHVPPRSLVEESIATVWRDLLGIEEIGVHDNFFALGGHSLMVARMVARLRSLFDDGPTLRAVFEAPTIADIARIIEAFEERHGERSSAAADAADADADAAQPPAQVPEGQPVPLSSAQQALWFIERVAGPSDLYLIPQAWRLRGALDTTALHAALQALVDRHAALRTRIEEQAGQPAQIVQPGVALPLPLTEVTDETALRERLDADAAEPFDLGAAPLVRGRLYRLAEHDHVLLIVIHHIVSDGWSMAVLGRELDELYRARLQNREAGLPSLPIGFADHAAWQRRQLDSEATARSLAWWREKLQGLEPLQLPTDRPRGTQVRFSGSVCRFELPPELAGALRALARRRGATLYMVLLAAFKVVLARYSGQTDVVVGSPVAGRTRSETEGLIGYFVNSIVLRTRLQWQDGFEQALQRVRQVCVGAYDHQDVPFDRLVAELSPERELGRNPLYQVSFALDTESGPPRLGDLQVQPLTLRSDTAKFDLSLTWNEGDGGDLRAALEYSTQLYDGRTIERLGRHLVNLLRQVVADDQAPIGRLTLMDDAERAQIIHGWNDTRRPYRERSTLAQLFEEQAARTPAAVAVQHEREAVSYGELNERANRLAHWLQARGVGPDAPVGVALERGVTLVVALLAIVKAGGAYVPLDPEYPAERLALMLEDTEAKVVLTQSSLLARLPLGDPPVVLSADPFEDGMVEGLVAVPAAGTAAVERRRRAAARPAVLCLDQREARAELNRQSPANPRGIGEPHHLAYVIYTSGSTGRPKGTAIPQQAVSRLVIDNPYVRLSTASCVAQASNSSFDAATFEIWGTLLNGGRLVVVPKDTLLSAPDLQRMLVEQRIDTMFLTTALFNEHALRAPRMFASLRYLLFGGEAVDPAAARQVFLHGRPRHLLNAYGPTETTTFATTFEVTAASLGLVEEPGEPTGFAIVRDVASVPIGWPIGNTTCHVLDPAMQPQPVGVPGELYIGGPGLARGYLNLPELTAERFVADPFEPGGRLYRTGDLVRRLADGSIDYLGRIDQQVKIRGFRIELGEIESVLARQPGVAQCAVIAREDRRGDKRLVAYLVAQHPDAAASPRELRAELAMQMPSYMVPAAFVYLERLPLTANGKLDRRALPVPGEDDAEAGSASAQPLDELELELQRIWQEVLSLRTVGPDDNFFDLGGHSLMAIRLLDAVAKATGQDLGLASMFRAPTVRSQAALLRARREPERESCVVAVQPAGSRPPLFFVSGFGGAILPFKALSARLGPDQPLLVLDLNSLADTGEERLSIPGIARRMIEDLRTVQPEGPYQFAGFSLGGDIVYEIARQLQAEGERVGLLALLDSSAPGYPKRHGFLVRVLHHVRHALRMGPSGAGRYLLERVSRLRKYFVHVEMQVFETPDTPVSAELVQTIQRRSTRVLQAWREYRVKPYPGRLTLVRAEVGRYEPGVIDDDPQMGWGAWAGGGVDIAHLQARHTRMLDAEHSVELAAILAARLIPGPADASGERTSAAVAEVEER